MQQRLQQHLAGTSAHCSHAILGVSQGRGCPPHRRGGAVPPGRSGRGPQDCSQPERGVVILPGLGNNASDYQPLADMLRAKGLAVEVAAVARYDWPRNAAALTHTDSWNGTLKPRPAVNWYLDKVDAAVDALKRQVDGAPITMLCHSAGGWLGRVYLLDYGTTGVDRLVTLGSPHAPPPPRSHAKDQSRGMLTFCSDACPGAYHPEVKYVTIAGRFVKGIPLSGEGTLLQKLAGAGYRQVCGEIESWGDFIVPVSAAHLDGAINVNLEGCFHSPLGGRLPFFGPWYGSEGMAERWLHYLTDDQQQLRGQLNWCCG